MKRLNTKLLSITAASLVIFVVGVWGLHHFQTSRHADAKLRSGDRSRADGDFERARWMYYGYLQRHPKDAQRYKTYATICVEWLEQARKERGIGVQDIAQVYHAIGDALRLNPGDVEMLKTAAQFNFDYREWTDAADCYEELIEKLGDTAPEEYRRNLLIALENSGLHTKEMEYLSRWLGFDPVAEEFTSDAEPPQAFCEAYVILANYLRTHRANPVAAEIAVNRMVEKNSDNFEAYLLRYSYYDQARIDKSEVTDADLEKALSLAPDEPRVVLQVSNNLLRRNELERMKELLDGFLAKHPDNADAYLHLSKWASTQQNLEQAMAYAEQGLSIDPNHSLLLWAKATITLDQKDFQALERIKTELKNANIAQDFIDFLTARELMAKGKWWEAQEILEKARLAISARLARTAPENVAMVDASLAECYERLSQHDRRLEAFNRMLQMNPGNLGAQWGRIECLLALDQIPTALNEYRRIAANMKSIEDIPTAFLQKHLQLEIIAQRELPEAQRNWAHSEQLVKRIYALENVQESKKLAVVADYFRARGNTAQAEQIEQRLKSVDPSNLELALSEVSKIANTNPQAALERLEQLSAEQGDTLVIRLRRFLLIAQIGGPQVAEKLAAVEADADELVPRERAILLDRMARFRMLTRDFEEAERLWKKSLEAADNPLLIYQQLFDLAQLTGDEADMEDARKGAESIAGADSAVVKWMQAARISTLVSREKLPASELEEARSLVLSAQSQRSSWDALYRLEGRIALQMGDTNTARIALEKAIKSGPTNPSVLRSIAEIYHENGQLADAERMIRQIDEKLWSVSDRKIIYEAMAQRGELPEDVVLDASITDPRDLIWHSQLFYRAGRMDDAITAAKSAVEAEPTLPLGWQNLVQILAANGKVDEAVDAINRAEKQIDKRDAPRLLGSCYEMLGRFGDAERYYKLWLEVQPEDRGAMRALAAVYAHLGQIDLAMKYLDEMLASPDGSIQRDVASNWARRAKARILAASQSFTDFNEALRYIEQNVPEGGVMSTEDLIVWGKLSADRTDEFSHARAVDFFHQVRSKRALTDAEQLLLAELYEKQGRWNDCKNIMQSLLARSPADLTLLAPWLDWLLKHDDLREAEKWLQNCPENSAVAVLTRVQLLVRRGRTDDAKRLLARLVPKGELTPDSLVIVLQIARLTEALGKYDPSLYPISEKLLREYLKTRPQEALELALFLGRRGGEPQVAEAIGICETFFKRGQHAAALQAANSVIYANRVQLPANSPIVATVRGWYEDAQQKEPESPGLMVQRAFFESAVQNFAEVERWLRRYLESEDNDRIGLATARNNLAYLLALRGEGSESLRLIEAAIAEMGPRAELRDTRATVQIARKEYQKALADVQAAMDEAGENAFRLFRQALAFGMMDNRAAAEDALKKAVDLGLSPELLNKLELQQYNDLLKRLGVSGEKFSARTS